MKKKEFEYQIIVDGKVIWTGLNPQEKFEELRKKNPGKEVAIAWKPGEEVLIA